MNDTFIISDYSSFIKGLISKIGFSENNIISFPTYKNESDWHDWTTQLCSNHTIDKLLIPLSIPSNEPFNLTGLRIALHIRLNFEITLEQRLIPIILLSDFSRDNILSNISEVVDDEFYQDNNPENLLFTKGIYLTSFDEIEITRTIEKAKPCQSDEYHAKILHKLKILNKAETGKHSIINAWGCFKLAQVAGLRDEIFKLKPISTKLKTFYSKYLICLNNAYTLEKCMDLEPIKYSNKKILLIDDQADEGWSELMTNIFKKAGDGFVCVNSEKYKNSETKLFHDFNSFIHECRTHIGKDWDLIIIDLRLNPAEEDVDSEIINPTSLWGYKLIEEFLMENKGYQIIVSTASNKIWNIDTALKRGASAYYIKESPEFNYTLKQTKEQYESLKTSINRCFKRSCLTEIYKTWDTTFNISSNPDEDFIKESDSFLKIAWNLIHQEQLDFGYLSLFQIIELFARRNYKYNYRNNTQYIIYENREYPVITTNDDEECWKLTFVEDKVQGDYFQSGNEIKKRNEFKSTALFKISCLLKFQFDEDDDQLKVFGFLNKLRNKIAHEGPSCQVQTQDIKLVLDIIKKLRS